MFFIFLFFLIFVRVYLNQTDDIRQGARSQMLPRASYLTSLCLDFFRYKMRTIVATADSLLGLP